MITTTTIEGVVMICGGYNLLSSTPITNKEKG
jgi:hypothetical protein